jgi:hypothetical protein
MNFHDEHGIAEIREDGAKPLATEDKGGIVATGLFAKRK